MESQSQIMAGGTTWGQNTAYDLLQVAFEVWRHGRVQCQETEGAGGGERPAEETSGGADDGCLDMARDTRKKLLTPRSRRSAVTWAMDEKGCSQRRTCGRVGMDPRVYRYRAWRPEDAGLRRRLRKLAGERRRCGYRHLHTLNASQSSATSAKLPFSTWRSSSAFALRSLLGSIPSAGSSLASSRRRRACAGLICG